MVKTTASTSDETTPLLGSKDLNRQGLRSEVRSGSSSRERDAPSEDLDVRFKRWLDYVGRRRSDKGKQVSELEKSPQILYSVFEPQEGIDSKPRSPSSKAWDGHIDEQHLRSQVSSVKKAIENGLHPKMIQTGSSGSYFIRVCTAAESPETPLPATETSEKFANAIREGRTKTVAVFKPHDEEPYGSLNPKRVLLRKYLWWAMGRPCLIPSFSYLSEVGASILDDRLRLFMVPSTRLEEVGSSAFSYTAKDRELGNFKAKVGSYQYFLHGYVNASTFLRLHPWPSRPRNLLEQDLKAENHAHGRARARARKGKIAKRQKRRGCAGFIDKLNCCSASRLQGDDEDSIPPERRRSIMQTVEDQTTFAWTKESMQDFRLELEKLVCLDYLMRNTDRGLDNFMVKAEMVEVSDRYPTGWKLTLAAIDNSLAFPWKHPAGIRSYPWGWLYLPTDLIGGNFSSSTREAFVPYLSSVQWWRDTESQLESLFRRDAAFDEKKFKGQMEVLRGQGWNLLESLRSGEEGPLELCARQKQLVKQDAKIIEERELNSLSGSILALTIAAEVLTQNLSPISNASRKPVEQKLVAAAIPIQQKEQLPAAEDSIQPRSLPEATNGVGTSTRWQHSSVIDHISGVDGLRSPQEQVSVDSIGDKAIGKAYRGKSLGIDVLAEIDKSSSKIKRPKMRKASTGHVGNHLEGNYFRRAARPAREEIVAEVMVEEDDGISDSVASLPSPVSHSHQGKPHFLKSGRRRNVSVGDYWSISSLLVRSHSGDVIKASPDRIKVLIERLEADDGIAWQTWLGLQ